MSRTPKIVPRLRRLVAHLLNIGPEEWEKVGFSWGMKFLLAVGHVVGHTTLLVLVATRYGVEQLPLFFVCSAALAVLSTLLAAPLLERVRKETLITVIAVIGSVALITGWSLASTSVSAAVGIGLAVVGAVMTQISILLALLIEEQYTPFEAQRTFPIIESAEVVGALTGGVILYGIASLGMSTTILFLVWAVALGALAALLTAFLLRSRVVPELRVGHVHGRTGFIETVHEGIASLRRVSFLRALAWTTFVIAAIVKLLEYQYAAALAGAASHGEAAGGHASAEALLTHALGLYAIAFGLVAFVVQLVASSRIIRRLGLTPSLFLSPALSTIGFTALFASFSPFTAIAARGTFDLTQVIYKDAYLASFYAVSHKIRERAKALIEGWVAPLGTLIGTLLLVGAEHFWHGEHLATAVSTVLVALGLIAVFLTRSLRRHYTQLSVVTLATGDEAERQTAVEVLGDRGHQDAVRHLVKRLALPNESPDMKVKVLETLGVLQAESAIPAILDSFHDKNLTVQVAAVEALGNFPALGTRFLQEAFTKYRVSHALKDLFLRNSSSRLKLATMRVFANLRDGAIIPFLLKVLREGEPELQSDCIQVIGAFRDPNIAHYLRPALKSPDPRLKSNAIIALWQFEHERLNLLVQLVTLLSKTDRDSLISTLYVLGEIRSRQELGTVERHLEHDDPKVRRHAAVALLKLGELRAIDHLLPILLGPDPVESWKVRQMLYRVDLNLRRMVTRRLHQEVAHRVGAILSPVHHNPQHLSRVELMELIRLYDLADQHGEVATLKKLLAEKQRAGVNGVSPEVASAALAAVG